MSTPILNSVISTPLGYGGLDPNVAAVIGPTKWGGGYGVGVDLDISFPDFSSRFITPYSVSDEISAFFVLTAAERQGVRNALIEWSEVANIDFFEVADNPLVVGDLRFAGSTNVPVTSNAHAYYPDAHPTGGDVWFRYSSWHSGNHAAAIQPGTYDFFTIIHEIGHALGLKHPFETPRQIAPQFDSYSFSIMSYSASTAQHGNNSATFYPTTPMYYDLLAIQTLYGARPHNAGNTTYTYVSGNSYWETIDDSGGVDTIRHVGTDTAKIDLRIGFWSDLGNRISFTNAPGQNDTVMTGPRSNIENATGGNGNDTLNGNNLANRLTGNGGNDIAKGFAGNDTMSGGAGNDSLDGGAGNDSYNGGPGKDTLKGGPGFDSFIFNAALTAIDTVTGYSAAQDVIKLARNVFTGIGSSLNANEFRLGAVATGDDHHILYLKGTGQLFFDPDGVGGDPAVQFARLGAHLNMNAGEFLMI